MSKFKRLEQALAKLEAAKLEVCEATSEAFPIGARVVFSSGYILHGSLTPRLHEAEVVSHPRWIGAPDQLGVRNTKTGTGRRINMAHELRFNK